ncbi:hypothetical protein APUTEX25_003770, partial [Auxenochlorella protothecoides]
MAVKPYMVLMMAQQASGWECRRATRPRRFTLQALSRYPIWCRLAAMACGLFSWVMEVSWIWLRQLSGSSTARWKAWSTGASAQGLASGICHHRATHCASACLHSRSTSCIGSVSATCARTMDTSALSSNCARGSTAARRCAPASSDSALFSVAFNELVLGLRQVAVLLQGQGQPRVLARRAALCGSQTASKQRMSWGNSVTCDSSMEMAVCQAWKWRPMYLIISAGILGWGWDMEMPSSSVWPTAGDQQVGLHRAARAQELQVLRQQLTQVLRQGHVHLGRAGRTRGGGGGIGSAAYRSWREEGGAGGGVCAPHPAAKSSAKWRATPRAKAAASACSASGTAGAVMAATSSVSSMARSAACCFLVFTPSSAGQCASAGNAGGSAPGANSASCSRRGARRGSPAAAGGSRRRASVATQRCNRRSAAARRISATRAPKGAGGGRIRDHSACISGRMCAAMLFSMNSGLKESTHTSSTRSATLAARSEPFSAVTSAAARRGITGIRCSSRAGARRHSSAHSSPAAGEGTNIPLPHLCIGPIQRKARIHVLGEGQDLRSQRAFCGAGLAQRAEALAHKVAQQRHDHVAVDPGTRRLVAVNQVAHDGEVPRVRRHGVEQRGQPRREHVAEVAPVLQHGEQARYSASVGRPAARMRETTARSPGRELQGSTGKERGVASPRLLWKATSVYSTLFRQLSTVCSRPLASNSASILASSAASPVASPGAASLPSSGACTDACVASAEAGSPASSSFTAPSSTSMGSRASAPAVAAGAAVVAGAAGGAVEPGSAVL